MNSLDGELNWKLTLLGELKQENSLKNVYTQFGNRIFVRADRLKVMAQCQEDIRRLQEKSSANKPS